MIRLDKIIIITKCTSSEPARDDDHVDDAVSDFLFLFCLMFVFYVSRPYVKNFGTGCRVIGSFTWDTGFFGSVLCMKEECLGDLFLYVVVVSLFTSVCVCCNRVK